MSNALEALLTRIRHLLHFGQDPLVVVEPDGASRGLLLNRLLDGLPEHQDLALLRYKKAPGLRKLRTDILSQWFPDPVFNPDDTLADSYLRLRQQPAQRLLLVDSAERLDPAIFREWQALAEETDDSMGLLLLVPEPAWVPTLSWRPIYLGGSAAADKPRAKGKARLWLALVGALLLASLMLAFFLQPSAPLPERRSLPLPQPVENQLNQPQATAQKVEPAPEAAKPGSSLAQGNSDEAKKPSEEDLGQQAAASQERSPAEMDASQAGGAEAGKAQALPVAEADKGGDASAETVKPKAAETNPKGNEKAQPATTAEGKPSAAGPQAGWPQSVPDSHYALQLMAGFSAAKLKTALAGQGVEDWHLVKTRRQGKVFYLLLQGNYANMEEAKAAQAKLPASFRQAGAWPKDYGKIKAEFAAGKG
ncbi:hypothetical protein PVT67_16685 [Gallaecimonas kandeliae]|uniref:SPOR domain-containing protein n=1 Tax=Gallaecimonas kandeliae TaxID=3029055 RepID=UPI002649259E|nr:SPOR domain-containing protein [Gallaecimonas kandeliae]WKE65280.1 hypothetical protein PVT67_16685 [Gallaecimonas kandeliae]